MEYPRIKACFQVTSDGIDTVQLVAEHAQYRLTSPSYAQLVPLLDGQRHCDDLIALLADRMSPARVLYTLDRLIDRGFVEDTQAGMVDEEAAYWNALGADSPAAVARLAQQSIEVIGDDASVRALFEAALTAAGLRLERGGLALILTGDYAQPALREHDRRLRRQGRCWLAVKPYGTAPWLGPLYRPERRGCHHCLCHRLENNRRQRSAAEPAGWQTYQRGAVPALPASLRLAAEITALELAKWTVLGTNENLEGVLLTVATGRLAPHLHRLVPWDDCPVCGEPPRDPVSAIRLDRARVASLDGGFRTCSAEETLRTYGHLVSPLIGLVPSLDDLATALPGPIHNVASAVSVGNLGGDREASGSGYRGTTAGKGQTPAGARASALGEALERLSGVFRGDEVRLRSSLDALGEDGIHPNTCMGFSQGQYAARADLNRRHSRRCFLIPEPFDPGRVIDWTPVWSLTRQCERYLPTSLCYYHAPVEGAPTCRADSNGAAAGNSLEEAILQGLLELLERDSVAIWWYNRLRRPAIDLDACEGPWLRQVRAGYAAAARGLWVLDITADLGVPTYAAVSARRDTTEEEIFFGFGAHPVAMIALERAVAEASQFLPFLAAGPEQKKRLLAADSEAAGWLSHARLNEQSYLKPDGLQPPTTARPPGRDIAEEIERILVRLREAGLEVLALNQTRADIGMPVVKLFVPGLRSFWNRFAPGRLYQVPVRMGWLQSPTAEADLNPHYIFF